MLLARRGVGGLPEAEFGKVDAIIKSMTKREKSNHQIIDGSRRKRLAAGSGTTVQDVNQFLKQFIQAKEMMSRFSRLGVKGMRRGGFSFGGLGVTLPIGGATMTQSLGASSSLIAPTTGKLVWSGSASTPASGDILGQVGALTQVTIEAMRRAGLI